MNLDMILNTDSYKQSHYLQYPSGARHISSYIEARGGAFDRTVYAGLQPFLREYMQEPLTMEEVNRARHIVQLHMPNVPFNQAGWERIVKKHNGFLPLLIEGADEGSRIQTGNVLVQVTNTDPELPWLTSFIETALLRSIWYMTTVATVSRDIKDLLIRYAKETSENEDVSFQLHDFGCRGASSTESAALGGLAHLINFMGTDTMPAIIAAHHYYDSESMAGFSIPAAEHSTITSWGKPLEQAAYNNMVHQFGGDGAIYAVVSDSYDLWNAIKNIWGKELREKVRAKGGRLVIRPDSGNPVEVTLKALELAGHAFGTTLNSKGYRVLPEYVRLIQGDGVNRNSIEQILDNLKRNGWAAENYAFGMGGALLQKVDRDTCKFAMKASAISFAPTLLNAEWRDVYKDPITDPGKKSKRGRLKLMELPNGVYSTIPEHVEVHSIGNEALKVRYMDGVLYNQTTFDEVRARSNA